LSIAFKPSRFLARKKKSTCFLIVFTSPLQLQVLYSVTRMRSEYVMNVSWCVLSKSVTIISNKRQIFVTCWTIRGSVLLSKTSIPDLGLTQLTIQWVPGFFPRGKPLRRELHYSPPSSAGVIKIVWS
jgi:hypothetical protein